MSAKKLINRQDHDDAAFRALLAAVSANGEVVLRFESRKAAESLRSNYYHWRKFMQQTGEVDCGAGVILRVGEDGSLVFTTRTVRPQFREVLAAAGVLVRENSDDSRPRPLVPSSIKEVTKEPFVMPMQQTVSNFAAALAASGLVRKSEVPEDGE